MPAILKKTTFDVMVDLAACLCAQIEEDGSEIPCYCGVLPGDSAYGQYIMDCADEAEDCGMAWVRLGTAYPSSSVGQPRIIVGNCGMELGLTLEIGLVRCIEIPDEHGPSPEMLLAATEQQVKDMLTMRKALVCCVPLNAKDWILGSYTPTGPLGGFVGGTWSFTVNV